MDNASYGGFENRSANEAFNIIQNEVQRDHQISLEKGNQVVQVAKVEVKDAFTNLSTKVDFLITQMANGSHAQPIQQVHQLKQQPTPPTITCYLFGGGIQVNNVTWERLLLML